jgi:hypothetical protein
MQFQIASDQCWGRNEERNCTEQERRKERIDRGFAAGQNNDANIARPKALLFKVLCDRHRLGIEL